MIRELNERGKDVELGINISKTKISTEKKQHKFRISKVEIEKVEEIISSGQLIITKKGNEK